MAKKTVDRHVTNVSPSWACPPAPQPPRTRTSTGSSNSSPAENTPRPGSSSWGVLPKRVTAAIPNVEAEQTCQRGLDELRRDGKDQTNDTDHVRGCCRPAAGSTGRSGTTGKRTGLNTSSSATATKHSSPRPVRRCSTPPNCGQANECSMWAAALALPRSKRRRGPRRPAGCLRRHLRSNAPTRRAAHRSRRCGQRRAKLRALRRTAGSGDGCYGVARDRASLTLPVTLPSGSKV